MDGREIPFLRQRFGTMVETIPFVGFHRKIVSAKIRVSERWCEMDSAHLQYLVHGEKAAAGRSGVCCGFLVETDFANNAACRKFNWPVQ